MNTIAWADATTALPMETNPRAVFERMFGGGGTPAERQARIKADRSILDGAIQSARRLQTGLGSRDRARLTQYLDNLREVERRIGRAETQASEHPLELDAPVGPPEAYDEHVALMFELLAVAFQADLTRVFTFMAMRDITSRAFPHIGVPDPHHALSHEANGRSDDPNQKVKFTKVNIHHTSLFAKFVAKLNATPDGDGTLLDNSMVLYGSGMSNANDHTHAPLPLVVAGGGSGAMRKLGHHLARRRIPRWPTCCCLSRRRPASRPPHSARARRRWTCDAARTPGRRTGAWPVADAGGSARGRTGRRGQSRRPRHGAGAAPPEGGRQRGRLRWRDRASLGSPRRAMIASCPCCSKREHTRRGHTARRDAHDARRGRRQRGHHRGARTGRCRSRCSIS
jgi:hypothetical protein